MKCNFLFLKKKIINLLLISIGMGMYYGFCFGVYDLEDSNGFSRDYNLI